MPRLIALKEVRYARRTHVPGTDSAEFEASEKDAKVLKAIGKAADAPAKRAPAKQAKQMRAEEPAKVEPQVTQPVAPGSDMFETSQAAGTYGRRDMRAED
jgi:hypothetical protein